MRSRSFSTERLIRRAAVAAVCVPLGLFTCGCIVQEERPARVYAPAPRPAPQQAAVEPVVVERYEPAPVEVVTVYEDDLNPHGHWVQTREYGRCWVPNHRPPGWQPYTVGHWVDTQYGWSWVADDDERDWGYVTYHYGRWYVDPAYGWVWIPGSTWAPAWVAWRDGGGYCGWAPLPPSCGPGVNLTVVEVDRYVPREHYCFVEERYMGEEHVHEHVVRNVTIINKTTNITNITIVNNRIVNRGVSVTKVEQASGHRVELVAMQQAVSAADVRKLRDEGKHVEYSPPTVRKVDQVYLEKLAAHERAIGRAQEKNAIEGDSRHVPPPEATHQPNAHERVPAVEAPAGHVHEPLPAVEEPARPPREHLPAVEEPKDPAGHAHERLPAVEEPKDPASHAHERVPPAQPPKEPAAEPRTPRGEQPKEPATKPRDRTPRSEQPKEPTTKPRERAPRGGTPE